jgi:hypothetical protein
MTTPLYRGEPLECCRPAGRQGGSRVL